MKAMIIVLVSLGIVFLLFSSLGWFLGANSEVEFAS